jgi:hypothetical protein
VRRRANAAKKPVKTALGSVIVVAPVARLRSKGSIRISSANPKMGRTQVSAAAASRASTKNAELAVPSALTK